MSAPAEPEGAAPPPQRIKRKIFWALLASPLLLIPAALFLLHMIVPHDTPLPGDGRVKRLTLDGPGGLKISYLREGDRAAPRVIYIHGTPGGATNWNDLLIEPVAGMESISIDRPGFGATTPGAAMPSLADQASALEPFLEARNGRFPILVGHSLGGPIICRAAADFPGKVGGLVIVAGSLDPALEKVLFIQRVGNFAFIPRLLPRAIRNSNLELIPLKAELETLKPLLAKIECPVAIVHGTKDGLVPYSNVQYIRENLPEGRIIETATIQGGNHFTPWNNAEAIRDAIEKVAEAMQAGGN